MSSTNYSSSVVPGCLISRFTAIGSTYDVLFLIASYVNNHNKRTYFGISSNLDFGVNFATVYAFDEIIIT